jgi:HlyD family secretion protein
MPHIPAPELGVLVDESPIEEIVGREPAWIVRSGITLISVVFMTLLLLTWFISFPDTVRSQITITTSIPPVEIISKVNGQILELYVKNNENIQQGQPLLLIESSVNYNKLQLLESSLKKLRAELTRPSPLAFDFDLLNVEQLGELQPILNQLVVDVKDLSLYGSSGQLLMQIDNTKSLSEQYQLLQQQLARQVTTWQKKLDLDMVHLQKQRELLTKGIITPSEILPTENSYLDKQLALEDINIQIKLYDVKLQELTQALTNFKLQRTERLQQLKTSVLSGYFALTSEIARWKQHYLISAPMTGQVSFSQFWSANQHVSQGDVILTVANQSNEIMGKIQVMPVGAGKIEVGQRVDIELVRFPAIEYGQLVGQVKSISLVPGEQGYLVDISLPNELTTTYNKTLPFTPNLIGNAKVITKEKRLLERFFGNILYLVNKISA